MSKYSAIVEREVATANFTNEARPQTYDRLRRLLTMQLRKIQPPPSSEEIKRERAELEDAIRDAEDAAASSPRNRRRMTAYRTSNTRASLLIALLLLIMGQSIVVLWLLLVPSPTTKDLDADLQNVSNQIQQASNESDNNGSGLIKALVEVRKQLLLNTKAMLEQKRTSMLRRIDLDFRIAGSSSGPGSGDQIAAIKQEIEQAEQKLSKSKTDAEQYSRGLVQAMAMMTVETDRLALSQLWLKYYSVKYGLPILFPGADFGNHGPSTDKQSAPGVMVKDRDAL